MAEITVPLLEQLAPKYHLADPLDRGLQLEFRLDRNTGMIVPDYSGYNRHGIFTGSPSPTWTTTDRGPAVAFTADNACAVIATGYKGLLGQAAHSSECVFRTTDTTGESLYGWGSNTNGIPGTTWMVNCENGTIWIRTWSGRVASWAGSWNDGELHHLIITKPAAGNLSDAKVYVDGVLETRDALGGDGIIDLTSFHDVRIGDTWYLDPLASDQLLFRMWDRVLIPAEVRARYQKATARASGVAHNWLITFEEEAEGLSIPVAMHHYRSLRT